jgi:uracil-DNA glycosylase
MGPSRIVRPRGASDARALARLHARIRACTRCVAAGHLVAAAPVVAGGIGDRVAIVGQAPGAIEVTTRVPFSGRAGAELERWLLRAGFAPGELPYRTAITKCFPGKAATGAGDRRPSPAEIALCAPWLEAELALLRPEIVVLLGTLAIERLWGRAPLAAIVGRSRRDPALGGALLIPLPHPSGASRWLNDPANRARLDRGLRLLGRAVRALPPLDAAGRVREGR